MTYGIYCNLRVGGFGHKIVWTRKEKSIPWLDNEPNGGKAEAQNCAAYKTVPGHMNGGGLSDVNCRVGQSDSRLLCRRPPLNLNSQDHKMSIVSTSTTSSNHSTPYTYTTTLVPAHTSESAFSHFPVTHTKRDVPSNEKDAGGGPSADECADKCPSVLIAAALGWSLFLLTFTFALALIAILMCQHTRTLARGERDRGRADTGDTIELKTLQMALRWRPTGRVSTRAREGAIAMARNPARTRGMCRVSCDTRQTVNSVYSYSAKYNDKVG